MSQQTPEAAESIVEEPAVRRSSLLSKLVIAGGLAAVVAVECLVAQWLLPSAAETAAMAGAPVAAKPESGDPHAAETHNAPHELEGDDEVADQMEVDLGEFGVTAYQPVSNSTLRIDFHLFGAISAADEKEFLRLIEENKHRFREQVLVITRSADITDLTDASLGLLKRKILDKTNRIIGRPLLKAVIVSDFSFIEQ